MRHYGPHKGNFIVLCKCPHCHKTHLEKYQVAPLVMPRRYCQDCKHLRHDEETADVKGLTSRKKQRRVAA